MYQDLRLYLNEVDITDEVIFRQSDLDIRQKFRDYRATIGLVIPSTSTISIKPTNEVKVKYTNTNNETRTLFGGFIFGVEYGEMASDGSIEATLDCEGFYPSLAGRRTITNVLDQELNPPLDVTEDDWMYYAGYLAASYVDKFLSQDGVSVGHIEAGRLLAATELEEFVTMSIKEIYDVLCEPSGHSWWIDNDKVFHFGTLLDFVTYDTPDDTVSIGNNKFTVKGCNQESSGFFNKVFIEGSDDWDAEVPSEYQDIYGRILYIKENTESINKLSLMNGNTGVFGTVIRDSNIKNLETAQYRANKLLSLYPDIPYKLRVDTFDDKFKPGDKVPVNLPFYEINNEMFTIHDINIEMATGKKPIFHMVLSNVAELGGIENLYQHFDQIGQRVTPSNKIPTPPTINPTDPSDLGNLVRDNPSLGDGLIAWADIQKSESLTLSSGKITSVRDAITGNIILSQVDPAARPSLSIDDKQWASFNPDILEIGTTQRGEYLNYNTDYAAKHMFVVYRDRTDPTWNSYQMGHSCPFPGTGIVGSPLGDYMIQSGSNYSLQLNGMISSSTQKRIRDTTLVANIKWNDDRNFNVSALGLNRSSRDFNSYFTGDIAEVVVYGRSLSLNEIETINNYLMTKYNL